MKSNKFKIGDSVKVNTKFHGIKFGTVVEKAPDSLGSSWFVAIPNHWTKLTMAKEVDMKVVQ
jgi:hypothetical protein